MCGICGFVCFEGASDVDSDVLIRMSDTLVHRGPDSRGEHLDGNVAFANRRLSIVDLDGGSQPKYSEDGTVCVVYNGEIYNHRDLRKVLEHQGHRFASDSDTEVVVHAYEQYGDDFAKHLNGMFAIALWDRSLGKVLFVRDRLGIKPLYYSRQGRYLVFGSEIKSLLAFPGVEKSIDFEALDMYLSLRYVPDTHSIFEGISKLAPGHMLSFDVNSGDIEIENYWEAVSCLGEEVNESQMIEEVYELIQDSVKIRLMSDVPFGAFLSGGVDSSAVVATMSRLMDEPVKSFSIGFGEDPRLDEQAFAENVASSCKTDHRNVNCTAAEVENLPRLLYHLDEPFSDPIIVPFHQVSRLAADHVKVVLTGEGADELFGGYTRYVSDKRVRQLGRLPRLALDSVEWIGRHVPFSGLGEIVSQAVEMVGMPSHQRYLRWVTAFTRPEKFDLLLPDFHRIVNNGAEQLYEGLVKEFEGVDDTSQMMYVELKSRLPECMLARTDRITMAVSLEARTPFLDHRLVERVLRIPVDYKVRGQNEKYLLKKAVESILPAAVIKRRKQGLAVPFALWTRFGINEQIKRILSAAAVKRRGIFQAGYVKNLLDRWSPRQARHSQLIWSLLCFEIWCRIYLDGDLDPATPLSEVT